MEWSLKEREGGRMEAERETQRGRDLGLKEDRETEEAEADMAIEKKQKGRATSSSTSSGVSCQVERCTADMSRAKQYHKRHKVCEFHAKAPAVRISGGYQRFCQQCSRFHELREFDEAKRSCRRRLAGHNERRRKSTNE